MNRPASHRQQSAFLQLQSEASQMFHRLKDFWDDLFRLDCERSIWIEPAELGGERVIEWQGKRYRVKIPNEINRKVKLRLRGLGKKRGKEVGDLYLRIWLNQGEDVRRTLWLPQSLATKGGSKRLFVNERKIRMMIPPNSHDGLTIRLKGLGKPAVIDISDPLLRRNRGNLLVKLCVYPDTVTPSYGQFDYLSTQDMVLEGWVYRKIDEVIDKMGRSSFPIYPIRANDLADRFNVLGWRGVFKTLVSHLNLKNINVTLIQSSVMSRPGYCRTTVSQQGGAPVIKTYQITINSQYVDNPFAAAAIMAHELCHVVYNEHIDESPDHGRQFRSDEAKLEEERTVDLLVFMFKIGEFQLRFARDARLTLGYFSQQVFERMQVIIARKLGTV
jgi:hypothetical protein